MEHERNQGQVARLGSVRDRLHARMIMMDDDGSTAAGPFSRVRNSLRHVGGYKQQPTKIRTLSSLVLSTALTKLRSK